MAIMLIESAETMRVTADIWGGYESFARARGDTRTADMLAVHGQWCRDIAAAIDAGKVVPGRYRSQGTAAQDYARVISGQAIPV